MLHLISGLIIGIVMGLTGAGGALIAIPLFMQLLGMGLKDASVLSLFAVVIASMSNFISQRKFADMKNSTIIVVFSALGSFVSNPYKKGVSDLVVAVLLAAVSLYALYSVWKPAKKIDVNERTKAPSVFITIIIGIFLGFLTTFTGLGGGVLMMPIFLSLYGYGQKEAVATSLLAVSLSSLVSLVIQINGGVSLSLDLSIVYLILGILSSAISLKFLIQKIEVSKMIRVRQVVFSVVVVIALSKIF